MIALLPTSSSPTSLSPVSLSPMSLSTAANPPIDWQNAQPGFTALIVVGVLFVSVGFLWRSFLKHAKKAKEPWEGEDEGA